MKVYLPKGTIPSMAREIELKIRLSNPEPFRRRLEAEAEPLGPYIKDDTYFRGTGGAFRLRKAGDSHVACLKQKTMASGIETSREIEFGVDDPAAFAVFAEALGFREWYRKQKTGNAWRWNNILIEEGTVSGLGWFAELEILLGDDAGDVDVEAAKTSLLAAVERLGARTADIEPRTYAQLLGHRER
jgi:predicted adenylyl cyclase CyaB